ncbi:Ldh family oxidoreductase [Gluconacetobacter azotocaptans]|uniref:Ldh family oxidoreductase n=1 Tax=Gluconacetobacter azotocaptans TaxID=142834 RepID=UPI00195DD941|nr:Ldh family oxidoreductase [Gluconacetobacter azotocaptans]MBM9400741.1 Ldh family oxidoreductase [Gluconacetobacter azotocaptans]GBQ30857.1 malate/L-lactate dehydrogenase [Gluconacetobacter azotocaptans DSM 13594]
MPAGASTVHLQIAEVEDLAFRALHASGLAEDHARAVAAQFAAAEADGIPSHGLARVPSNCQILAYGKIAKDARPVVTSPRSGIVHLDAGDGFPHLGIAMARPILSEAVRENGIASLVVTNAYACGVLGYHTENLAREGLVILGFTHAPASMAPAGGRRPVVGTNPMSLAVPSDDGVVLLIDQSSSVVAKSEVMDRHMRGEGIPDNWAFDQDGRPTTSAAAALQGGTMAPFGGYKGFGIGLIVEVFSALLTNSNLGVVAPGLIDTSNGPPRVGAYFIAVDPAVTGGGDFNRKMETLLGAIGTQPGTRIPGSRRHVWRRQTAAEGVEIPRPLYQQIKAIIGS